MNTGLRKLLYKTSHMCLLQFELCIITEYEMFSDVFFSALFVGLSRGSAIGIATCYGLDDRRVGVRVFVGSRI
jgi:hypothetical protein